MTDYHVSALALPRYSARKRWIIYALIGAQMGVLGIAARATGFSLSDQVARGLTLGMIVPAALILSLVHVLALVLAHSPARQHLGMALALMPLAGLAGLSVYVN